MTTVMTEQQEARYRGANHRRPKGYRPSLFPTPISQSLATPLQKILRRRGFDHTAILHYWREATGDLSVYCSPVQLKTTKTGRYTQLVVKVHPAYSIIIEHQKDIIMQRLTHYIGYRPAERIVLVQ